VGSNPAGPEIIVSSLGFRVFSLRFTVPETRNTKPSGGLRHSKTRVDIMALLDDTVSEALNLLVNPWVALINIALFWQFTSSDYYGMLDAENKTALILTTIGAVVFVLMFIVGAVKITGIKPIIAGWVKEQIGRLAIVEIPLFIFLVIP
jgi:hypothetical protein